MKIDWNEDPGGEPTRIGDKRFGFSDEEARHELRAAIHFYPLLENAIRGGLKRDVAEPHEGDGPAVRAPRRRGQGTIRWRPGATATAPSACRRSPTTTAGSASPIRA